MAKRVDQFKARRPGFGDLEKNRCLRTARQETTRHELRAKNFTEHRDLKSPKAPHAVENKSKASSRTNKLEEWRKEKELKKKKLQQKAKKPFVVGVYHPPLCPVPSNTTLRPKPTKSSKNVLKKISKATEKRLAVKAAKTHGDAENLMPKVKNSSKSKAPKASTTESSKFLSSDEEKPEELKPNKTLNETFEIDDGAKNNIKNKTCVNDRNNDEKPESSEEAGENLLPALPTSPTQKGDETINVNSFLIPSASSTPNTSRKNLNSSPKEDLQMETDEVSKTPVNSPNLVPAMFSPYIVCSRGKSNARKEQELRRGLGRKSLQVDDIPTKDTVMQNLNISIDDEERTSRYFRLLVENEVTRLMELCEKWEKIKSEENIEEDSKYIVIQAIGQTKLLINKKIQRFQKLVTDCEEGKGEQLVTCKDLQGFWDMTCIEINNCEERFRKLDELKAKNWVEDEVIPGGLEQQDKKKLVVKRKRGKAPEKNVSKKSRIGSIKDFIMRQKAAQESKGEASNIVFFDQKEKKDALETVNLLKSNVTVNVGTPMMKSSSAKNSATKAPRSLKRESPLMMMRVSNMFKTPRVELDDSISYINSRQTPGRSILKKIIENPVESATKSTHKVNFNETVLEQEFPQENEVQMDVDEPTEEELVEDVVEEVIQEISEEIPVDEEVLAREKPIMTKNFSIVLEKIDSCTGLSIDDEEYVIQAGRKLNFEDTDDETNSRDLLKTPLGRKSKKLNKSVSKITSRTSKAPQVQRSAQKIPEIKILPPTPQRKSLNMERNEHQHSDNAEDLEKAVVMRTLRSGRVVATPLSLKTRARLNKFVEQESLKNINLNMGQNVFSPGNLVENLARLNVKVERLYIKSSPKTKETVPATPPSNRRSARKSVRFNADQCMACSPRKTTGYKATPDHRSSTKKINFDADHE